MNERQEIEPKYTKSESKVIASAAQLREANPQQLQMYTIQNDFTRTMYASGQWFNDHPECLLRDADGLLVNHTQSNQAVPECTAGANNDTCYVYGFNTQCGREAWVKVRHTHIKHYVLCLLYVQCSNVFTFPVCCWYCHARQLGWRFHRRFTVSEMLLFFRSALCVLSPIIHPPCAEHFIHNHNY